MITSIKVNGFRSLVNFELVLNSGLNILVGPNGSGKTNIITFFEFLSQLIQNGPSEAVNKLGGAGTVFSKIGTDEFRRTIEAEVNGRTKDERRSSYISYNYKFKIEASEDFDSISFKSQELLINSCKSSDFSNTNNIFEINQSSENAGTYKYEVKNFNKAHLDSSYFPEKIKNEITRDEKIFTQFLEKNISAQMPLVDGLSMFIHSTLSINEDLRGGQVFNIIPSKVKTPEESSFPAGIQKDGFGLAATLYAIKNKKTSSENIRLHSGMVIRRQRSNIFLKDCYIADILRYVHTANPAIQKIDVENDRFDNMLKVSFWIENEKEVTKLPLSAMSDGTIKWLSLVTAILTAPSIFSIEEPENFLHPLMQSEVVKLMRNSAQKKNDKSTIVMSTHSETILNSAHPDEIVIVSFENGSTKAHRCNNPKEINDEIEKTGFGLGYYYLSGSLSND